MGAPVPTTHVAKTLLDDEDKALLDEIVAVRKLTYSDTLRVLIREEHQRIVPSRRKRAANG